MQFFHTPHKISLLPLNEIEIYKSYDCKCYEPEYKRHELMVMPQNLN